MSSFSGSQIRGAGLVQGLPPIAPGRSSLAFSNRAATGNYPQTANRQFFSRNSAPAASGRGVSGGQPSSSAGHDWSRFGTPIHGAATTAPQSGGWSSFGARGASGGPASGNFTNGSAARTSAPGGFGAGYQTRPAAPVYGYPNGYAQPVRISPSIVQQRVQPRAPSYSAPATSYPSYGNRTAPNYQSAPSYRAPAATSVRSAPSGGGGGGRPSSGGGGHSGGGHR